MDNERLISVYGAYGNISHTIYDLPEGYCFCRYVNNVERLIGDEKKEGREETIFIIE